MKQTDIVNILDTLITHIHGVLEECKERNHVWTTKKEPQNKQTKTTGAKGT